MDPKPLCVFVILIHCLHNYKDKTLGDQIILADFGGFLVIGGFFGRQYYLSYSSCK